MVVPTPTGMGLIALESDELVWGVGFLDRLPHPVPLRSKSGKALLVRLYKEFDLLSPLGNVVPGGMAGHCARIQLLLRHG